MEAKDILNRDLYTKNDRFDLTRSQTTKEVLDDLKLEEELKQLPREYYKEMLELAKVYTGYTDYSDPDVVKYSSKEFNNFVKTHFELINYVKRRIEQYVKMWKPLNSVEVMKLIVIMSRSVDVFPFFLKDPEQILNEVAEKKVLIEYGVGSSELKGDCLYLLWIHDKPLTTSEIAKDINQSVRETKRKLKVLQALRLVEVAQMPDKWKLSLYAQHLLDKKEKDIKTEGRWYMKT